MAASSSSATAVPIIEAIPTPPTTLEESALPSPGSEGLRVFELVSHLVQRVFHDTKPYLLKEKIPEDKSPEEYIREHFISKKLLSKKNEQFAELVKKVCEYVVQQFKAEDETHLIKEISHAEYVCVLHDSLGLIRETYGQLQEGFPVGKPKPPPTGDVKEKPVVEFSERNIGSFVASFNMNPRQRVEYRKEAIKRMQQFKKQGWEYYKGVKTVPRAEAVPSVRDAFFKIYFCKDPMIKEMALNLMIEIMECDPLTMNTAYNLVELQRRLLLEIKATNAQNLTTSIQRLLIKAYSITLECILIHASMGHLNAITNELKDEIWSGADDLDGMNVLGDEEIMFWAAYAIQGAQHLKTDKSEILEWIERLALIVEAGVVIASAINSPDEGIGALAGAYENLNQAFWHVRWRKEWFKQTLILKKLCRYSINDVQAFRQVVDFVQKTKREESGNKLFYGVVSVLEYVIAKTTKSEIQEEGLKLLLQYLSVDNQMIKERVTSAFVKLLTLNESGGRLQNTAYQILRLMEASKEISTTPLLSTLPLNVKRTINHSAQEFERSGGDINKFIFVNVIKFMLRRMAEIKQEEDIGGHSFVTLLSSSNEDKIVPNLLKILKSFSTHFLDPDIYGQTPYHISVKKNNLSMIEYLHASMPEIDINFRDYQYCDTAMHIAAKRKLDAMVEELVKLGANPDIQNAIGDTPLHIAVQQSDPLLTSKLLYFGTNPNLVNSKGETPLNIALHADHVDLTEILVKKKADIAERVHQCTPIIIAAQKDSEKTLMYLIKRSRGHINKLEGLEILRMISRNRKEMTCSQNFLEFHHHMMTTNRHYPKAFKPYCLWPKVGQNDKGDVVLIGPMPKTRCEAFGNTKLIQLARKPEKIDKFIAKLEECEDLNHANYLGITSLHTAVACRNSKAVTALLENHACVDALDARGNTPLHLAVYIGDFNLVNTLLEMGANPNISNDFGDTPLMIFAGNLPGRSPSTIKSILPNLIPLQGKVKIAEVLLSKGANPHLQDVQGNTILHHALMYGASASIKFIFRSFPELFWVRDNESFIPIQEAAFGKKTKSIKAMLDTLSERDLGKLHKEFIEREGVTDTLGNILANLGDAETFQKLLKRKPSAAFLQDSSPVGETPLHMAARLGQENILHIYQTQKLATDHRDGFGNTSSHLAALRGHEAFFHMLIQDDQVDFGVKNHDQRTPLHLAALSNQCRIVKMALAKDYKLAMERDGHGDTPLHLASRYGNLSILEQLFEHNPKAVNAINDDGNTPLHLACAGGDDETAGYLIARGADIEARNIYGETPFLLASQEGHLEVIKLLHRKGADFWSQDDEKESALHKAVFNLHVDIVRELLKMDKLNQLVAMQDIRCEIPIHEIAKTRISKEGQAEAREEILSLLMNAGSSTSHIDELGETFLHPICSYGAEGLLEFLLEWSVRNKEKIDFSVTDTHQNTLMHKACENNQIRMIDSIMRVYVNINAKNQDGHTGLHIAAKNGFIQLARILVRFGAKLKSRDKEGKTILHHLLSHGKMNPEILAYLEHIVKLKPELILISDNNKETPVHVIARNNHPSALNVLLRNLPGKQREMISYLWKENTEGQTAFTVAKEQGHSQMRRMIQYYHLENLGADHTSRRAASSSSRR